MRLAICAVLVPISGVLALSSQVRAAQPPGAAGIWRLAHPDARFVLGVDWARAKASPAGRTIARQFAGAQAQLKQSGFALNAFQSLDRILISGREDLAGGGAGPSFVIALEGTIDRATVKRGLPPGTALEKFKGVDLYVPPGSKPGEPLLAILSGQCALIGDRESLALILSGQGGLADAGLYGRAARMAVQSEIWLVASGPFSKPEAAGRPPVKPFDDIQSVDLGVSLQDGVGVRATLVSNSEQGAKGLATFLQLIASMAAQNQPAGSGAELASLMKNLHVDSEGAAVRIRMNVSQAQFERSLAQATTTAGDMSKRTLESFLGLQPSGQLPPGFKPAVRSSGQPYAAAAQGVPARPAAPERPATRTIRITGAEGGPKEITYSASVTGN